MAKAFNVSSVTVWKALRFEQDTDTIRRIQKAARERGGIVMAVAPVMETLHDHDNVIRNIFRIGALLRDQIKRQHGCGGLIKGKRRDIMIM